MSVVEAVLYAPDGVTRLATLPRRWAVQWDHELNGMGRGSLTIDWDDPIYRADPTILRWGSVVRYRVDGTDRFAMVVDSPRKRIVTENADRKIEVSGPGVRAFLGRDVVHPEMPLASDSGDDRAFGWQSRVGPWLVESDWHTPIGKVHKEWKEKFDEVEGWPVDSAWWLWYPQAPDLPASDGGPGAGDVCYFRSTFNIDTPSADVAIWATWDDDGELYLDGSLILQSGGRYDWKYPKIWKGRLSNGMHTVAAKVTQGDFASATNVGGFLFGAALIDSAGNVISWLRRSNPDVWVAHPGPDAPGWHKSQIVSTLIDEGKTRGTEGWSNLSVGFGTEIDSEGATFTDRVSRVWPIATTTVEQAVTEMIEAGLDVEVDPDLTVQAWVNRGVDRTDAVRLHPSHMVDYAIEESGFAVTRLILRHGQGWVEVSSATGEAKHGKRWAGGVVSSLPDQGTADAFGAAVIDGLASPQRRATAVLPDDAPMLPYRDFGLGDTISAPSDDVVDGVQVDYEDWRVTRIGCAEDDDGGITWTVELGEA